MRFLLRFVIPILVSLAGISVFSTAQVGVFYYSDNKRIYLTPDPSTVAAKLNRRVNLEAKFPRLKKYFQSVKPSFMDQQAQVLFTKRSADPKQAEFALSAGKATKEINPIPTYLYGPLKLILQNEVIVGFKPDVPATKQTSLLRKFSSAFRETYPGSNEYVVTLGNPESTLQVSNTLHGNHLVQFAQPNFVEITTSNHGKYWVPPQPPPILSGPLASTFPDDELYPRQWSLENKIANTSSGKLHSDIKIQGAWDVTQGSDQIRVAVLDDGVDINHPDLRDSILRLNGKIVAWDSIKDFDQMTVSVDDSHGTRVAGIIAARINNAVGIAGIAPNVKLIPIRIGSSEGLNMDGLWTTRIIVENAIRKAVDLGADVINASWFLAPAENVTNAIGYAISRGRPIKDPSGQTIIKGTVFVAASGDHGKMVYPAQLADSLDIIAVGATNSWDEVKTRNSKDGENWWDSGAGKGLTIVAPGVGIVTTDVMTPNSAPAGEYIDFFWGTSAAAPEVSGVVALMLSVHPELTAAQVKQQLINTADKINGSDWTTEAGWGRINACRALGGRRC